MWPYIPPYSPPCCIVKNYFALSPWGKSTKQQDANERKRIYPLPLRERARVRGKWDLLGQNLSPQAEARFLFALMKHQGK
jgi:hypothetical protein